MRNKIFLFFLFLSQFTYSQILNDTVSVYGEHTTSTFTANDLMNKSLSFTKLDTTIYRNHLTNNDFVGTTPYQSLGVMGTALKPMFMPMPDEIGYSYGYTLFSPYKVSPGNTKFYDTKSPFSRVKYTQGSTGETAIDILLTQNIIKQWNFGGTYRRFTSRRLIGSTGNKNTDKLIDNNTGSLFSSYLSKNKSYSVIASMIFNRHIAVETGGLNQIFYDSLGNNQLFNPYRTPTHFKASDFSSESTKKTFNDRIDYFIYHQLKIAKTPLIIYHKATYSNEMIGYIHPNFYADSTYLKSTFPYFSKYKTQSDYTQYDTNELGKPVTGLNHYSRFRKFQNTVGLKYESKYFYANGNVARNQFDYIEYNNQDLQTDKRYYFDNLQVGLSGRLQLDSIRYINGSFERIHSFYKTMQLQDNLLNNNDYKIELDANYKGLSVGYKIMEVSPSMQQTLVFTNLYTTSRYFNQSPTYKQAFIQYNGIFFNSQIRTSITNQTVSNYIYLSEKMRWEQQNKEINFTRFHLGGLFKIRSFYIDQDIFFTQVSDTSTNKVYKQPRLYNRTALFYSKKLFKGAMLFQPGIEARYIESYYADAYSPVMMSFYVQDKYKVQGEWLIDLFINAKISRADIFFKFTRINKIYTPEGYTDNGYFTTPLYTGMKFTFQFGVTWRFFQ